MRGLANTMPRVVAPMRAVALAGATAAALAGCVSTDELYAEYDATLCPIEPPALGAARAPVALPGGELLGWPPAVYFGYDDATVDARAARELDDAIRVLEQFPDTKVLITGFTSKLGSADYNRKLSTRRVANVKAYLADAGIGAGRTVDSALGEGLSDVSPYERVANAVNRRVGLTLLDVEGRPARHALPTDATPSSWPVPPPTTLRAPRGGATGASPTSGVDAPQAHDGTTGPAGPAAGSPASGTNRTNVSRDAHSPTRPQAVPVAVPPSRAPGGDDIL